MWLWLIGRQRAKDCIVESVYDRIAVAVYLSNNRVITPATQEYLPLRLPSSLCQVRSAYVPVSPVFLGYDRGNHEYQGDHPFILPPGGSPRSFRRGVAQARVCQSPVGHRLLARTLRRFVEYWPARYAC